MVENIAIVGLNREQSYEVAKQVATQLDMYFFDSLELFEFDNIPRTLSQMLEEYGEAYFRKKEKSILKYACNFSETVIHLESGMANDMNNFKTVKSNCLLIYIHQSSTKIKAQITKTQYKTKELRKMFDITKVQIDKRIERLKKEADIVVDASRGSDMKIASDILRSIKNYYNVI